MALVLPPCVVHQETKRTWPHGKHRQCATVKLAYELRRHTGIWAKYKVGGEIAWTNCSLVKVRSVWDARAAQWKVDYERPMALYAARGKKLGGHKVRKRKRNMKRLDLRVKLNVGNWKQPFWHRLLGWYFHRPRGLRWQTFVRSKEVDHTNRLPAFIDWRELRIVDCQGGR